MIRKIQKKMLEFVEIVKQFISFMRNKEKKFMISQNDPRKTNWELFVIVLALYNSFFIPFELSFQPPILAGAEFFVLNSIIDFLFGVDIFISFRTTFYHPITGDEIMDLKIIRNNYFKGRFVMDFLSTIPFDNLMFLITGTENKVLAMLSLLKLFRVTRLSRIIARLNVSEDTKNSLKLFQLIFFIVMYIHCMGCAWFSIAKIDETWVPPLDLGSDHNIYEESLLRQYFIGIYHSVLMMMGNDIYPVGDL